jgi:hypothetical protein
MENKIVQKEHSKEKPIDNSDIDFYKADALTDEEIEERAKTDPDAPVISAKFAKKARKLNQNKS